MKILLLIIMIVFAATWFAGTILSLKRYFYLEKLLRKNGWLGYFPGPR